MAKKITFIYALFWIVLLVTGLLIDKSFLLSSQIAFFSSIFILFVSYNSYKKKVFKKLQAKQYENKQEEDDNTEEITLKSEKERLKANKTKIKDLNLTTAFVPNRLLAYISLAIGFIALKKYEMLSISGFLIGLLIMPIGAITFGIIQNKKEKKDV